MSARRLLPFRMRTTLTLGLVAIILLLTGAVAVMGWQQWILRGASVLLAEIGHVERLMLGCRNREKAFLLQSDTEIAAQHERFLDEMMQATRDLQLREVGSEERKVFELLERQQVTYGAGFRSLVENAWQRDMDRQLQNSLSTVEGASIVFMMRRLARDIERRLVDQVGNAEALRDFLQARRYEKNLLLYGDVVLFDDPAAVVAMWDRYLDRVAARLADDGETSELLAAYRRKSGELRVNVKQRETLREEVEEAAQACHELIAQLRELAIERVRHVGRVAEWTGASSLALAVAFCLLIVWFLNRHVVAPIEALTTMAGKTEGDIQDLDVEFADIDFGRYRSRESADLARALQLLVRRLRGLVSSERGLMQDRHMAAVLLMDRAVGSSGRAILERARAAAGLEALTDLGPGNLDLFLQKVEHELRDLLSQAERDDLLEAIRAEMSDTATG